MSTQLAQAGVFRYLKNGISLNMDNAEPGNAMTENCYVARCKCGRVSLEFVGAPIDSTVCHCSSCQKAGRLLDALPGATPILDKEGGTPFVLFRKDRMRCTAGETLLAEHRLTAETPTRRVVATCCNTAMFLDFTKGHWVSMYRGRFGADVTGFDRNSRYFVPRLIWTWVKMGFRTPKIEYVRGRLDDRAN